MSVVCRSFRQNAWKKDLCSDCFRPENDHQCSGDVRVESGPIIITSDWNGKVQTLRRSSTGNEMKKCPTNGFTKIGNSVTFKDSTGTTMGTTVTNDTHDGDVVNGKVAFLNQRNRIKSDEPISDYHTNNGSNQDALKNNVKSILIKTPLPCLETKVVGILKNKKENDQPRKGSVQFLGDPIVIGYCSDDDSGNEEEPGYCDYSPDDDDDYSEEDSEFSRLTASNTRFNSIGANLRDAKLLQTFGQINNQSNGSIAFRIGDFKSETRKHDYDETLIGCNKVSELIGDDKRGKLLSNGSTQLTSQTNGINGFNGHNGSSSAPNNCNNQKKNNKEEKSIKSSNGDCNSNRVEDNNSKQSKSDSPVKSSTNSVSIGATTNLTNTTTTHNPTLSTTTTTMTNNGKPLFVISSSKIEPPSSVIITSNPNNNNNTDNNDNADKMTTPNSNSSTKSSFANIINDETSREDSKANELIITPVTSASTSVKSTNLTITSSALSNSNNYNNTLSSQLPTTTQQSPPLIIIAPLKSNTITVHPEDRKLSLKSKPIHETNSENKKNEDKSENEILTSSVAIKITNNNKISNCKVEPSLEKLPPVEEKKNLLNDLVTVKSLPITMNGKTTTRLEVNGSTSDDSGKDEEIDQVNLSLVREKEKVNVNEKSKLSTQSPSEEKLKLTDDSSEAVKSTECEMVPTTAVILTTASITDVTSVPMISSVESNDVVVLNGEVDTKSNKHLPITSDKNHPINEKSKLEIPKKPERTLRNCKPKIPSKPLSLSHGNKVADEDGLYFNGDSNGFTLLSNADETVSPVNGNIYSEIDLKCETNPIWDNLTSNRELRLAELAQELEQARFNGKRPAPQPPNESCAPPVASERSVKYHTFSRANLPAPPPRPPPPNGLAINGVTNGHHTNNIISAGSSTKFSLKKLLKLSKDDNDVDNNGDTISGKIWKHKFDLDRRKNGLNHREIDYSDRTSGSYDVKSAYYENLRERSYSLTVNGPIKSHLQTPSQQYKANGVRPTAPARRSRSTDITAQSIRPNSLESPTVHRYISTSTDRVSGKIIAQPSLPSQTTPITVTASSSSSPPSSSTNPTSSTSPNSSSSLLSRPTKLSSPTELILTNLSLDSAYTVIAKYNIDTINRILHNYSLAQQFYKNISKKDLFYESFRLIGPDAKLYKDAYLKSETISAHFLVTPLAYSIRSEASCDLQFGQFIDNDENVKLFALKPEFDLIITFNKLLDEDFTELTANLNLKSAAFIVLQFIALLKYYQANGMEEIHEEQLKLTMLCYNSKQSTNNLYLISPSFDYVSNVTKECFISSTSYSLCKCLEKLVKNLKRKLSKGADRISLVEDVLNDEKTQSLLIAKTICEIIFFEVPLNFENPSTLGLWLDIQRTKFINQLNCETNSESTSNLKTVFNYYFMLFLTRSDLKILFESINQLRGQLLLSSN